jgi:hypothetical protein
MDFASPTLQLFGVACTLLVAGLAIAASVFFLIAERTTGAWLMLAGAVASLLGDGLPQSLYALENFVAVYLGSLHEHDTYHVIHNLMYYTIWNWLSTASRLVFMIGLVLVALRRRLLSKRITELESILEIRNSTRQ